MSALKLDELLNGSPVFMVDFGGGVVSGTVLAVKKRPGAKPQVCVDLPTKIIVEEFYLERFFPTEKEAWYASAMFAQRSAQNNMAAAQVAFKKAGIASDEVPETPAT